MITVLTRTCGRDNYLSICKKSIQDQTKKPRHIIGSDIGDGDVNYQRIKKTREIKNIDGIHHRHAPYNLYINDLIKACRTSHAIILDDDDMFIDNKAIEKINREINKWHDFVRWKTQFPNWCIPRGKTPPSIDRGKCNYNIASCGFCFKVKWAVKVGEWSWSDGKFAMEMYLKAKKTVFIDECLTSIQKKTWRGNNGSINDRDFI